MQSIAEELSLERKEHVSLTMMNRMHKRMCLPLIPILSLVLMLALYIGTAFGASRYPMEIRDGLGRKVTIPARPMRIISTAPGNTEILFALGLESRIVGVTTQCNYPDKAKGKAKIGDYNLNFEKIVELEPDLVVADANLQKAAIDKMESLGLRVIAVAPKTIDDVFDTISLLGKVTDTVDASESLLASLRARKQAVIDRVKGLKSRPKVFVEIWNEPLMTAGPGTFLDELITLAGGVNIAKDAKDAWPQFSTESVVARDPDVIILTCFNKQEVLKREAWKGIKAIRTGKVYEIVPDAFVRTGPRLIDALEEMAKLLHPEAF